MHTISKKDWNRQQLVLIVKAMTESYTAWCSQEILASCTISTDCVVLVLRDGGANIVKGMMRLTELPDLSCSCCPHFLQLVINNGNPVRMPGWTGLPHWESHRPLCTDQDWQQFKGNLASRYIASSKLDCYTCGSGCTTDAMPASTAMSDVSLLHTGISCRTWLRRRNNLKKWHQRWPAENLPVMRNPHVYLSLNWCRNEMVRLLQASQPCRRPFLTAWQCLVLTTVLIRVTRERPLLQQRH